MSKKKVTRAGAALAASGLAVAGLAMTTQPSGAIIPDLGGCTIIGR